MITLEALVVAQALAARVERGAPPQTPGLAHLCRLEGPLGGVTATCLLLSRPPGLAPLVNFLRQALPRLLAQLNCSTRAEPRELRGGVRGRIDWAATVRARGAAAGERSLLISRSATRQYDLPENRLLKHFLTELARCHACAPQDLEGWCLLGEPHRALEERLARIAHDLHGARKSAALREVAPLASVDAAHLRAAQRARNPLYAQLGAYYQWLARSALAPQPRPWAQLVRQSELIPAARSPALNDLLTTWKAPIPAKEHT